MRISVVLVQCTTATITLTAGGICMEYGVRSLASQKALMTLAADRKDFPPGKLNSPSAPDPIWLRHLQNAISENRLISLIEKRVEPVTLRIGSSASRSRRKCLRGRFPADSEPLSPSSTSSLQSDSCLRAAATFVKYHHIILSRIQFP